MGSESSSSLEAYHPLSKAKHVLGNAATPSAHCAAGDAAQDLASRATYDSPRHAL